jgi:hypothetical protein
VCLFIKGETKFRCVQKGENSAVTDRGVFVCIRGGVKGGGVSGRGVRGGGRRLSRSDLRQATMDSLGFRV